MLLIFGTKIRERILQVVLFACPQCGVDRQGARVSLRRWFTLFFLPIVPLGELGEAVRCDTCRRMFDTDVLDRPTGAVVGEARHGAIRVVGALLVGAGDPTSAPLRSAAVLTIGSIVPGYDDATLSTDLQVLDPAHVEAYVAPLATSLDLASRERFLAELTRVAVAGGDLTPAQRQLLERVGGALAMTPAHVAGVLATGGSI